MNSKDLHRLRLHCAVILAGIGMLVTSCGPATVSRVTRTSEKDMPSKTKKTGEDLETIRIQKVVEAPKYVKGIDKKAQDAFRKGVKLVHKAKPEYAKAIEAFEAAITIDKKFMEAYFNVAMVHERLRQPDKALTVYQRALKANPDSADAKAFIGKIYLAKARELSQRGKLGEAGALMAKGFGLFKEVLARDYENVPANNALALYWLMKGDIKQAEDFVRQALTMAPENVTALNTRGLILLRNNRLRIAEYIFKDRVLKLDPNSVEAWTNLGIVYVRRKVIPKAAGCFVRAVELEPSNVAARMNLGAIYIDFLNFKAAESQYKKVLAIQPKNVEAVIGWASSRYGQTEYKDAVGGYKKAFALDKRRFQLLLKLADLLEKQFANDEKGMNIAISYYEQYVAAAKLPPEHKLSKRIIVLKEMIKKGMLKELKFPKKPVKKEVKPKAKPKPVQPAKSGTAAPQPEPEPEPEPESEKIPAAKKNKKSDTGGDKGKKNDGSTNKPSGNSKTAGGNT